MSVVSRRGISVLKDFVRVASIQKNGNRLVFAALQQRYSSQLATATSTISDITEDYKRQVLSKTEVETFHRDGVLVLRDFLTPQEKSNLKLWCEEIQSLQETPGKWFCYYEDIDGVRTLCRTENFFPYHDGIRDLIQTRLVKAISDCLMEPSCLFKEKINYKLPKGGAFPPHQDAPAYTSYNQKLHITSMIAVDPMTKENGCLEVVTGRHQEGIIEQDETGSIHPDVAKTMDWKPIYCEPGTMMIFNAYAPHKSDINTTEHARRVYYLTFNAISDGGFRRDDYYTDKRRMFPPEIERVSGMDYSEGAKVFNLATPITNKKHDN